MGYKSGAVYIFEAQMEFVMLVEPDGTENSVVTRDYAIIYCRDHAGWSWREL